MNSTSSRTTNHLHMLSIHAELLTHHGKLDNWTTILSSLQTSAICQARSTLLWTPYLIRMWLLWPFPTVNLQTLTTAQQENFAVVAVQMSLGLQPIPIPATDVTLLCNFSAGTFRPYCTYLQSSGDRFSTSSMVSPTQAYMPHSAWLHQSMVGPTRRCSSMDLHMLPCQCFKVHVNTRSPVGQFRPPDARFDHIPIDLVGPMPPVSGYIHLLACVDQFACLPEVIPLTNTNTEMVAQAFLFGWVARYGIQSSLTSDRGDQFECNLWHHLMTFLGMPQTRTTAYHPSATGLVKRFHRHLKAFLMNKATTNWFEALPPVLLGIPSSLKDLHCSSAELVYGTTL